MHAFESLKDSYILAIAVNKMGKGSKERPRSVSYDEYSKRWEAIFNKEEEEEELEQCPCGEDECCE